MTATLFTPETPAPAPAGAGPRRTHTITLPAGLRLLNANQRPHYRTKAKLTSTLRAAAMEAVSDNPELMAALAAAKPGPLFARAHILGVLHPPTRRRADPANWYPSFKAAVDGIVDAGVLDDDDHAHLLGPDMRLGDIVKGGQLVLVVRELAASEQWPDLGAVAR